MDSQDNAVVPEALAEPTARRRGVPPKWVGWLFALAAEVSIVLSAPTLWTTDISRVFWSVLGFTVVAFLLLRRWASRRGGYLGLLIVLVFLGYGIASAFQSREPFPQGMVSLSVALATIAAWCFRQHAPRIAARQARSGTGPEAGIENSMEAMAKVGDVLADLAALLPPQWSAARLEFREIGNQRECLFTVEMGGARYTNEVPAHLMDQMSEIRQFTRGPGGRTWFECKAELDPAKTGHYETEFIFREPAWRKQPEAGDYLEETERMTDRTELPVWFLHKMATAG